MKSKTFHGLLAAALLIATFAVLGTLFVPAAQAGKCKVTQPCVVLNPPRQEKKKVRVAARPMVCQTRTLSQKEWKWVKANRKGCWFATTTEGYRTPLFYSQSGTHCAPKGTNDWGYTEQTTGKHLVFHL